MERKGFTLIEILASLAAFGIMFVAIGSIFFSVYLNWKKQRDFNRNFQSARWAMEFMGNEIRHANTTCLSSGSDYLYFSQGGTCSGGGNWNSYCYFFNSTTNTLFRCDGKKSTCSQTCAQSQSIIATSIADVDFSVSEIDMARIVLTVRPKPAEDEKEGNRNITFETRVRARN